MGDRANVCVKSYGEEVYLYTHWYGCELPAILQRALRRRERWDDGQYLARIIFCEMVKDDVDGETGFGISASVGDGADRVLEVDVNERCVTRSFDGKSWSIEDFIGLDDAQIGAMWSES